MRTVWRLVISCRLLLLGPLTKVTIRKEGIGLVPGATIREHCVL